MISLDFDEIISYIFNIGPAIISLDYNVCPVFVDNPPFSGDDIYKRTNEFGAKFISISSAQPEHWQFPSYWNTNLLFSDYETPRLWAEQGLVSLLDEVINS